MELLLTRNKHEYEHGRHFMRKMRKDKDAKAATPQVGRNRLKDRIMDKVEMLADEQFTVNIDPGNDRELEDEIEKAALEKSRPPSQEQ